MRPTGTIHKIQLPKVKGTCTADGLVFKSTALKTKGKESHSMSLIALLLSLLLLSGCAKIKFQDRLYKDFEEFTRTIQDLPEDMQISLGKNIAQLENAGYGLIDKGKSAGQELAQDFRKEFEEGFNNSLRNAKTELSEVVKLADDIAEERLMQADEMAKSRMNQADRIARDRIDQVDQAAEDRIKQFDVMREKSLNKTDSIIQGAISGVDNTLQNAISTMDVALGNKLILANDLAKQDAKAFMAHLDTFMVKKADLANRILEQRINQIFRRLNSSIELASNELDKVMGKNIHRFYYMGDIVAKDLIDAARKSTTMLFIVLIKGVIIVLTIIFLFSLIMGILKSKIPINPLSIISAIFFLAVCSAVLFTDVTERMIGERYIKIDDVFLSAEKNFKEVEAIFNSETPPDAWKVIALCTETIKKLEMCKVLSPPDNEVLQAYYADRIDDVNWLLSKSLPEKYLKRETEDDKG